MPELSFGPLLHGLSQQPLLIHVEPLIGPLPLAYDPPTPWLSQLIISAHGSSLPSPSLE